MLDISRKNFEVYIIQCENMINIIAIMQLVLENWVAVGTFLATTVIIFYFSLLLRRKVVFALIVNSVLSMQGFMLEIVTFFFVLKQNSCLIYSIRLYEKI